MRDSQRRYHAFAAAAMLQDRKKETVSLKNVMKKELLFVGGDLHDGP